MLFFFGLTLFVSATLLFLVQPMIGKMILPQLGGTPAVWNTCMVFFQGMLLLGYGYTHLLTTTQPTRRQLIVQGVMLLFPFLVLPFALGDWQPPTDSNPIFYLFWKLLLIVGLPFFAVSTTAPLLQKWFVHTGHHAAKDPYFLYGASNLGSMVGLALYPAVIEPWLKVAPAEGEDTFLTQVHLWTAGFAIFTGMVIACAVVVWKCMGDRPEVAVEPLPAPPPEPQPEPAAAPKAQATAIVSSPRNRAARIETAPPTVPLRTPVTLPGTDDNITFWRRVRWIGLAAVPSSLMLGVTSYMTTDIAAVAFFWILPLALYLFTFILVFAQWPMQIVNGFAHMLGIKTSWPTEWTNLPHTLVLFLQPCLLLFLVLKMIAHLSPPTWAEFLLHLGAFFSITLMCHGELAKDRPSPRHLTEFYFWMSFGGVLGGLFNALFAPIAFQTGIWEYPIALSVACLLRSNLVEERNTLIPGDSLAGHPTRIGYALDWTIPIIIGALAYFFAYAGETYVNTPIHMNRYWYLGGIGLVVLGAFGSYYFMYADHSRLDTETLKSIVLDPTLLRPALLMVVGILSAIIYYKAEEKMYALYLLKRSYLLAALVVCVLALSLRPIRFGLAVGALFIGVSVYDRVHDSLLYEGRGFFGLLRVRESTGTWYPLHVTHENGQKFYEWKVYRTLIHGGINHGRQIVEYKDTVVVLPSVAATTVGLAGSPFSHAPFLAAAPLYPGRLEDAYFSKELTLRKRREPITYFHERNGVAEIYSKCSWPDARLPTSMVGLMGGEFSTLNMLVNGFSEPPYAVLGLGTGILASYAKPCQAVDFYEIDPLVRDLSLPPTGDPIFWFLRDARDRGAALNVKMGDGRLKIKEAPEKYYHIISLDAFSSDAIPVHLLTAEAVELYMSKLADGGVLIFNTTNRYVRIEGVLAAIAKEKGYDCLYCPDYTYETDHPDRYSADWVVLQRKVDKATYRNGIPPIGLFLEKERKRTAWDGRPVFENDKEPDRRWQEVVPLPGPIWTDSYSNLLNRNVMRWGW